MAVDQFLKLEGIDGESKDTSHAGEIDVLAWSWGLSQSGTFHTGGGGGAGKVAINDINVAKAVDLATPNLMQYASTGKPIPSATLTVRKAGADPLEYTSIKMTKVMITSVQVGGSQGDESLTENVTLNFAKVEFEYTSQNDDGTADRTIPYGWDIEANKAT